MSDHPAPALAGALPAQPDFRRLVVFDMAVPFLVVVGLEHWGAAPLLAYAVAGLYLVAKIVLSWLWRRGVDVVGVGVLGGIGGGLLLAVLTHDPRFALVRAAPAFALFGAACFVSLFAKRPLMFFVARAFASDGDRARAAAWNERLALPAFRRAMRRVTIVWGAGTLAEAAAGVAAAFLLPARLVFIAEPVIAFAVVAALLAWTRALQRRAQPATP